MRMNIYAKLIACLTVGVIRNIEIDFSLKLLTMTVDS